MMCDHCDEPIKPGEAETLPIHGDSGGGATVVLHRYPCRPVAAGQPQRYPERRP